MKRSFEISQQRDVRDAPMRTFEEVRDLLHAPSLRVISFGLTPQFVKKYIRERFELLGLQVGDFVELTATDYSTLQNRSGIPTGIESVSLGIFRPNGDNRLHVQNLPDEVSVPTIDIVSNNLVTLPSVSRLVDLPGDYNFQELTGFSRDISVGVPIGNATAFCRLQQDSSVIVLGGPRMVLDVLKVGVGQSTAEKVRESVFFRRYLKNPSTK